MRYKYSAAAVIAMALASPCWAADAAPKGSDASAEETGVPDIIVTAQHREETLQKIPLAVTVIGGDVLNSQNIESASRLQTLVPGLKIIEIGVQPSIFIRGIGGAVANVLNDPAAAYNVDGVAISRPIAINGLFFDLARAEVLKGPQGTLYGGNSTVGAINIVSNAPVFDFGGSAGVTFGNYDTVKTQGVINVPVSSTLALRASFQTNKHDGYIRNGGRGFDDADDVGIRLKALFKPSDTFDALLTGTYYHSGGVGPGDVPLKSPTGDFLDKKHPWRVGIGPTLANGGLTVPDDGFIDLTTKTINAQVNIHTSIGVLTTIPSYIKTNYRSRAYDGGFEKNYVSSDREAGVETRLASDPDSDHALKWQIGGIYQDIHQVNDVVQLVNPPNFSHNVLNLTTVSWGVFAQGTYALSPRLRLTGGVRYTHDHKDVNGYSGTLLGSRTGTEVGQYPTVGDHSWSNVSYRGGFDFDLTPASMLYGNVSTGYKTGGINPGLAPNTFKPEHLTSFQLGSKNSFLNHKLQVNLEAWYWIYRDFQQQQFVPINVPPGFFPFDFGTTNADKAKNYGVEAQINWLATKNDRLSLNVQYDKAKYVDFIQTTAFPFPSTTDYGGQRVNFAPVFSGNVMFEHTFDLGEHGTVVAGVNDQFASGINIAIQQIPGQRRGSTNVTDLQLTYHAPQDRWQLGGYIENLQNEPVILFAGATPAGLWGHPRAPRTYGVRASAKF